MPHLEEALKLPPQQQALVCQEHMQLAFVNDAPIPQLAPDMVLVKTAVVALNPTDHKMVDNFPSPGAISGCDFSGTVVSMGSAVDNVSIGDRVLGGVYGADPLNPQIGAFGQYVGATADILAKMPEGMSFEDAAAIGGAGPSTIALAVRDSLGLDATPAKPLAGREEFVLVYGGSTAMGTMALQFLKLWVFFPFVSPSSPWPLRAIHPKLTPLPPFFHPQCRLHSPRHLLPVQLPPCHLLRRPRNL